MVASVKFVLCALVGYLGATLGCGLAVAIDAGDQAAVTYSGEPSSRSGSSTNTGVMSDMALTAKLAAMRSRTSSLPRRRINRQRG